MNQARTRFKDPRQPLFYRRSALMMSELNGNTVNALLGHFQRKATYLDLIRLGREGRLSIKGIGPKRNTELERWLQKWICPVILI